MVFYTYHLFTEQSAWAYTWYIGINMPRHTSGGQRTTRRNWSSASIRRVPRLKFSLWAYQQMSLSTEPSHRSTHCRFYKWEWQAGVSCSHLSTCSTNEGKLCINKESLNCLHLKKEKIDWTEIKILLKNWATKKSRCGGPRLSHRHSDRVRGGDAIPHPMWWVGLHEDSECWDSTLPSRLVKSAPSNFIKKSYLQLPRDLAKDNESHSRHHHPLPPLPSLVAFRLITRARTHL
jgi:hypothetical protein